MLSQRFQGRVQLWAGLAPAPSSAGGAAMPSCTSIASAPAPGAIEDEAVCSSCITACSTSSSLFISTKIRACRAQTHGGVHAPSLPCIAILYSDIRAANRSCASWTDCDMLRLR